VPVTVGAAEVRTHHNVALPGRAGVRLSRRRRASQGI